MMWSEMAMPAGVSRCTATAIALAQLLHLQVSELNSAWKVVSLGSEIAVWLPRARVLVDQDSVQRHVDLWATGFNQVRVPESKRPNRERGRRLQRIDRASAMDAGPVRCPQIVDLDLVALVDRGL